MLSHQASACSAAPSLQSIDYVSSNHTLFVWRFLPIPLANELPKGGLCTALDTAESRDRLPESPSTFPGTPSTVGHASRACSCLDWNAASRTHASCLSLVCHSLGVRHPGLHTALAAPCSRTPIGTRTRDWNDESFQEHFVKMATNM